MIKKYFNEKMRFFTKKTESFVKNVISQIIENSLRTSLLNTSYYESHSNATCCSQKSILRKTLLMSQVPHAIFICVSEIALFLTVSKIAQRLQSYFYTILDLRDDLSEFENKEERCHGVRPTIEYPTRMCLRQIAKIF